MGLLKKLLPSHWVKEPTDVSEILQPNVDFGEPKVMSDDEMKEMLKDSSRLPDITPFRYAHQTEPWMTSDDYVICGKIAYKRETAVDEVIMLASDLATITAGLSRSIYFGIKEEGRRAYQKSRDGIKEKIKKYKR